MKGIITITMSLIDKFAFESRSRSGCSNSDYRLYRTGCCGGFGVEDDELMDFYFDPVDLSRRIFFERGVACPFCGAKEFELHQLEDFAEMPVEWRWAAPRDLSKNDFLA